LQAKIEAVAKQITGDMLSDTGDNFLVRLQRVHEVEGSHTEHVFTRRPHAYKLSMRANFHSCIKRYCILENHEYTAHRNRCVFF